MTAAADDYTPFGYLRNPGHRAASWQSVQGGNLRTADDTLGLEWVYPWHKNPTAAAGISLTTSVGGRACLTRADFAALGYACRHHSADVLAFEWAAEEVLTTAFFCLVDPDALGVRVRVVNQASQPRQAHLGVIGRAWARDATVRLDIMRPGVVGFSVASSAHALALADSEVAAKPTHGQAGETWAGWDLQLSLGPGRQVELSAVLGRAETAEAAAERAQAGLPRVPQLLAQRLTDDARFQAACPDLSGDWPAAWREGLWHDLQTTRGLVLPAGGIFQDVWPSWMAAWPRVVLAEGTLDMLRLAFADPATAQRAVLSLFRDAPMPNVPCVFQDGGYNMLAADGRRCGTSPAWCLPFLNLELLYLRTLDRDWLGALYPYLTRYLDWWLEQRVDAEGFAVYACTWESGEDGNPRLDPSGSGDGVISDRVRPVELQATVAHAASVLAFFAAELHLTQDRRRWLAVQRTYTRRTQRLFDPDTGRFRDWLAREQRFVEPCPDTPYWGVDACRWSPLSLTPLLLGLAPSDVQAELDGLACAPWTSWPSWCSVLVECAAAAGRYAWAGQVAWEVIDRVYRVTTRRGLAEVRRPTPGASPEFWPQDWRTFQGCDAYGWGATTANLLVRHLIGFKEARATRAWQATLTPGLPPALRQAGRHYSLRNLLYRGLTCGLSYLVEDESLTLQVDLPRPMRCSVRWGSTTMYASRRAASRHQVPGLQVGQAYGLRLS